MSEGFIKKRESISGIYSRRDLQRENSKAGMEGAKSQVGSSEVMERLATGSRYLHLFHLEKHRKVGTTWPHRGSRHFWKEGRYLIG